ncbi:MAG TPA: segregation/condensation protein A [Deltaproteobacteria bacterium]|nr:segregation/condensation protein A [Deltaproteobacteria bacterium]HOM28189.1 segregation/condensation protein A [Deltaproteobacteria bacterium]HPP80814.1 segregation/condensation protein A [Deltaproteobacteria bacterium]
MEEPVAVWDRGETPFVVSIQAFEGPLDLLLYLIERNRFTLQDVQVSPIVDQYLAYMERARRLDISLAGEFLDMASYLIWLKSRILLPKPEALQVEDESDPVQELRDMLVAYRAVKAAAGSLGARPMLYWDTFPRGADTDEREITRASIAPLLEAVAAIRLRTRKMVMDVMPKRYSLREIMAKIQSLFARRSRIRLLEAVEGMEKGSLIAALMAALEMSRLNMVRIAQKGLFAPIFLLKRAPVVHAAGSPEQGEDE